MIVDNYYQLKGVNDSYANEDESVIYNHKTGRLLENPSTIPSMLVFNDPHLFSEKSISKLDGFENITGLSEIIKNPEPFAIISMDEYTDRSFRYKFWDEHPYGRYRDLDAAMAAERSKHLMAIPLREFNELPSDGPQENSGFEVNESVIRKMVKAAITEIIRRGNDIK